MLEAVLNYKISHVDANGNSIVIILSLLLNMAQPKPKKGVTKTFHEVLFPYAELMRIDRPVAVLAISLPYFYGFGFAILTSQSPSIISDALAWRAWHIFFSTFILRSMGCAWNDTADVKFDRLVERTKNRPLARGAISLSAAYCFTAGLLLLWSASLVPLVPQTIHTSRYAIPLLLLVIIYPYGKRFTDYAQVILGVTLGFGVPFGAAFGGFDTLSVLARATSDAIQAKEVTPFLEVLKNPRVLGVIALFAAYSTWTIMYDTVYALQDIRDDKKIGLQSMAIRTQGRLKPILSLLCALKVLLLAKTAMLMHESVHSSQKPWCRRSTVVETLKTHWPFFIVAVVGNAVILPFLIINLDVNDPKSCGLWFKTGSILIGLSTGLGFTLQYILY